MKKILLLAVLAALTTAAMAIPAHPKPIKFQQPDGSFVTVTLHGDEWIHFNTTEDGYSVVKDKRGYFVYAELSDGKLQPTSRVAHDMAQRSATEKTFLANTKKMQAPEMEASRTDAKMAVEIQQRRTLANRRAMANRRATSYSNFRGLVILVEFNDKAFSRTDYSQIVEDMLNKKNYTGYENEVYTGSVRDYFNLKFFFNIQPRYSRFMPTSNGSMGYDCSKILDSLFLALLRTITEAMTDDSA